MKKKNILISIFAMVFMAMTTLFITSCDKDDDSSSGSGNVGGGNTPINSIVGTWKGDITEGEDQYEVAIVLKIRNDNTGTVTMTGEDYYGYHVREYDLTYKMTSDDEGYFIIEVDDEYGMEYERVDFELNGNIMYVYDDDYYYDDEELVCILRKQ